MWVVKKNEEKANKKMKVPAVILNYYEDLRSYSLGNRTAFMNPLGMDLFMKKGTAAWIAAWSDYPMVKASNFKTDTYIDISHENIVPQAIQQEIIILLANMILSMEVQHEYSKEY